KLPEVKVCDGELRVERERLLELLLRRVRPARERERPPVIQARAGVLGLELDRLRKLVARRLGLVRLDQQDSQVQPRLEQVRLELEGLLISLHRLIVLVQARVGITEVEPRRYQVRLALDGGLQRGDGGGKILAIERLFGRVEEGLKSGVEPGRGRSVRLGLEIKSEGNDDEKTDRHVLQNTML